jgi:transposase-like protein
MGKRKRYTPEEKVSILREVVEDGKAVSAVANNHDLSPSLIFGNVLELLEQTYSPKKPDVYSKGDNNFVHKLCF